MKSPELYTIKLNARKPNKQVVVKVYGPKPVAELVAASNDMFEALEAVQNLVNSDDFDVVKNRLKVWELVDKVLLKAKGKI